jgi:hypothetical protein
MRSLLMSEATTVHKATVTAVKIAELKASGKSDDFENTFQQFTDEVAQTYEVRLRSVYGDIDVRRVVLEAVLAVNGVLVDAKTYGKS